MAEDWIKMNRGLRTDPKVLAMARNLMACPTFQELVLGNVTNGRHVTFSVTFANVTRHVVAGLLDIWGALNSSLADDGTSPVMALTDIDFITDIPSFGNAMKSVGWVIEVDSGGLMFPNFSENNKPQKSRVSTAKTPAQRAKEYRDRKKIQTSVSAPEEPSRHVTTDKIRIEIDKVGIAREFPSLDQVLAYASSAPVGITPESAAAFFDSQEADGWINRNGHPIADWRAALRRYSSNWNTNRWGNVKDSPGNGQGHPSKTPSLASLMGGRTLSITKASDLPLRPGESIEYLE